MIEWNRKQDGLQHRTYTLILVKQHGGRSDLLIGIFSRPDTLHDSTSWKGHD